MDENSREDIMAKIVDVKLTKVEIELLHGLVQDHIDSGVYWGNKNWFILMQRKVYEKLADAYHELENEP
jgi:hypothetical protein